MKRHILLIMLLMASVTPSIANKKENVKDSIPFSVDYESFQQTFQDVPQAVQILTLKVIQKSLVTDNEVSYTLPNGEIIKMLVNDESSCDKFWKRIVDENQVKEICEIPFGTSY